MSFSAKLRKNETAYKLVKQVVEHICTANGLDFKTVWATVSNREPAVFDRHFRRERRRHDPLNNVKKPRTAFSFFTQEQRPKISEKHPEMAFGDVSKLVGQQWASLDATTKAGYLAQEAEDKKRYEAERIAVLKANAEQAGQQVEATLTTGVTAAEVEEAPKARKPRAVKAVAVAASGPVSAPAAPVVAETAAAKKGKKAAAAAAPAAAPVAAPVAVAAPVVVAAVATKKGKKGAQSA